MSWIRRTELPTWFVALAIYASWIVLTLNARSLPLWLLVPLGGYVIAWHGSLQHEIIHGHPTRSRLVNELIALPPLAVWLPYAIYRDTHLAHHAVDELTHPVLDPESRYVEERAWATMGTLRRAVHWIDRSLMGRLVFGPAIAVARFGWSEVLRFRRGDRAYAWSWIGHVVMLAALGVWLVEVCELGIATYLLAFAYPGLSLTLLRSFTEHRPAATQPECSVIVESGPVTSLMFLNNNLHVVHHADPAVPWYELPAKFRARRDDFMTASGNFYYPSYFAILWRHGMVPLGTPLHTPREHVVLRPG